RLRGAADAGDLDPRQRRAETGVLLLAGLRAVLADPHLRAALVGDDLRRDGGLRLELAALLPAEEEDVRMEGLALLLPEVVHEQLLALTDDVLLTTEADDRVLAHRRGKRGRRAREERILAALRRLGGRGRGLLAAVAAAAGAAARLLLRLRRL